MKIVLPGIFVFVLWSSICYYWYVCGIHELCNNQLENATAEHIEQEPNVDSVEIIDNLVVDPLTFEWSGATPLVGDAFEEFKDSLSTLFDEEPSSVVEITGLYDPQELNNSNFENLGLARAQAVKDLLISAGIKRSINLNSKPEDLSAGLGDRISNGVQFALNPMIPGNGFAINRTAHSLVIHFPSNSANPRSDQQVLDALAGLAQEAKAENRSILVVGHTDNQGDAQENKVLGLIRATIIKDILMESGMSEPQILAESEGEDAPMANNETSTGRQLNRRVELAII